MHDAGIPNGVVNLVNGYGETAGKALTEHPLIQAIAFVGETTTGSYIMAQGAPTLKRVHFELGGKNPVIVFADADLERALDAVIFMKYSLNGERCTSSSRVLIERPIYDEFIAALTERVKQLKVGNPLDPDTEIGPLIEQRHWEKVSGYVGVSQEDGATVAVGDGKHPAGLEEGHYINPTEEEALTIANSVKYGLAAYIWTKDVTRALNVSHKVEAGMVWVNSQNVRYLPTPFGGVKSSGIGRDGGDYSFDFYMETKNVSIALGDHRIARMGVSK